MNKIVLIILEENPDFIFDDRPLRWCIQNTQHPRLKNLCHLCPLVGDLDLGLGNLVVVLAPWYQREKPVREAVSSHPTWSCSGTYEWALFDVTELLIGPFSSVITVCLCLWVSDDTGLPQEESVGILLRDPDLGEGNVFAGVNLFRLELQDGVPDNTCTLLIKSADIWGASDSRVLCRFWRGLRLGLLRCAGVAFANNDHSDL